MFKTFVILSAVFFFSGASYAQKWDIGISGGGAGYMGDLNQRNLLQVSGTSFSGFARYNINGYVSVKLGITSAQVEAADSTSRYPQFRDRNLSFFSTLKEAALTGEFNFFNYVPELGKNKFTPYIYAGVAVVKFDPKTMYKGDTYGLRALTTEGQTSFYKNTVLAVPFGAGIKYNIAGKLTLMADVGYRTAYTDYLDDVSGIYANPEAFKNNNTAIALADRSGERTGVYLGLPGTQRGDLRGHDTYMFFHIGISYTFISQKCYY